MKTLACFLATWITATALLLWLATRHDTQQIDFFPGTQITLTAHHRLGHEFWHSLWVAGVYSVLNTFIVRFWQMQVELKEKS
jgi:predicted secreted protein